MVFLTYKLRTLTLNLMPVTNLILTWMKKIILTAIWLRCPTKKRGHQISINTW